MKLTRTPDTMDGVLMIDTVMEIEIAYIITIYKDYKNNQYKSCKLNSNQLKTCNIKV